MIYRWRKVPPQSTLPYSQGDGDEVGEGQDGRCPEGERATLDADGAVEGPAALEQVDGEEDHEHGGHNADLSHTHADGWMDGWMDEDEKRTGRGRWHAELMNMPCKHCKMMVLPSEKARRGINAG